MEYTLITGGAGFIGSHICIELYKLTKNIVVIDNYSNSSLDIEKKIKKFTPQIIFLQCDIRDTNILNWYILYLQDYLSNSSGCIKICE